MEVQPIKRHSSFVKYSREHHFGLLLVLRVRRGVGANTDAVRIKEYVLNFFGSALYPHFISEEKLMFPLMEANDSLRVRCETEHRSIYALINRMKTFPPDPTLLSEFADQLEKHIRFEERELFTHLEKTIEKATLEKIFEEESKLTVNEPEWTDKFWK